MVDDFGSGNESSDLRVTIATGTSTLQHGLARQPRQKVSIRTRNTKGTGYDGERVGLAKSDKTSCFGRTENRIA
jgi:hypothetical protein